MGTNLPIIVEFEGRSPRIAASAFIAPNATIVGDVEIADDVSIWFGAVLRGDFAPIRIGRNCNIQDNVVAHGENRETGLVLEEDVTVGHSAIIHGARIEKKCLIGMGAVLLSGSIIGAGSLVAAGSVVREHCKIPPNCLAAGNPAEVKRALQGNAARWAANAADDYAKLANRYKGSHQMSGE
jgi:carbonic anhydrase/acetyltransferase-like protein (isoleucine patch superfamily)